MDEKSDNLFQIEWGDNYEINRVYRNKCQTLREAINSSIKEITLTNGGISFDPQFEELLPVLLNTLKTLENEIQKINFADFIFGSMYPTFSVPNPKLQSEFWKAVIKKVWNWEDENEKVHKGTPYFFMAHSFLALGDVPSAYTYFFNAIEEDKRNYSQIPNKDYKDAPANKTTSLVNDPQNALYDSVVTPLTSFLYSFILRTSYSITLDEIERKFLINDDFEDSKRFFVANFHEIYHLEPLYATRLIRNDYSKLKTIDTLFNFALIIDQILEKRFQQDRMARAVYHLWLHYNWTDQTITKDAGDWVNKINPCPNNVKPDDVLQSYLDCSATYNGQNMTKEMCSTIVAYHLRNYSAHNLVGNKILITNYRDILEMIMLGFFLTIDSL